MARNIMLVRCASADDVATISELGRRIHAETRFSAFDYNEQRVVKSMETIINIGQSAGTHCVLIAEDRLGSVAGILLGVIERHIFSDLPVASIMMYYVFPEKRMSGAGFKLLSTFRRWGENRSAFEMLRRHQQRLAG